MRKTSIILMAAALPMAVQAANTEFKYGGYIKFDAMVSKYSDGALAAKSAGRDFYIPAATPTANGDEATQTDFGIKTSRFNFKTTTTLDDGQKVVSFIELDFLLSGQGDERISNSYSPRLRHAFFKYGNYTFGQTWTTFMNPAHLPESVDFLGVSDGTVFARQAMIRYTNGPLQLALENSETTVNDGGRVVTDDATLPDVIVRYNVKSETADFMVAAIGRQLAYVDETKDIDEKITRFGFTASGKIRLGKDDIKFSVSKGHLGRYVGLNASNDATLTAEGELEGNNLLGAYLGVRHFWTDSVRSSLIASVLRADNHEDAGAGANESSKRFAANVMWSPAPKMTFGVEASKATLKKESGAEGDMKRVHFTAKYAF